MKLCFFKVGWNNNDLWGCILSIVVGVVSYVFFNYQLDESDLSNWNSAVTYFLIITILSMIAIMKIIKMRIVSFTSLFLLAAFVFYCGQAPLNFLAYELFKMGDALTLFGKDIYVQTIETGYLSIYFVFFGMVCAHYIRNNTNFPSVKLFNNEVTNEKLKKMKIFPYLLLLLGLPATIYAVIHQYTVTDSMGYASNAYNSVNPVFNIISKLVPAAIAIILFQIKSNYRKYVFGAYIIFCILTMIGGVRSSAILNILVVGYIYCFVIEKIKIKPANLIPLAVLGYVGLNMIVVMRDLRWTGYSIDAITTSMIGIDNVFLDYMSEAVISSSVLSGVILFKSYNTTPFGGQFFASLLAVIPGSGYLFSIDDYFLQNVLSLQTMGGSFVSDFYFDNMLIIASFFMGCFLNKIFFKFEQEDNIYKCALWGPIITQLIFSIRSSVVNIPRLIIWYYIIFTALKIFSSYYYKRRRIKL